ncbi:hypothetical protein [Novosphingobium aquimarinum]|uniref:hypothetical protein n=1 Tax=Novosphingobium aquimarinum TaxID=2682494 RepID=UPI0012EC4C52|nr:hypothetical protein [Novosphingobium aquimarinum]
MLRLEDPHSFGTFTILFAAAMFTGSLSSALFGAPVQTLQDTDPQARTATTDAISSAAVAAAILAIPLFALLAMALDFEGAPALFYAVFVAFTILRQYGRAWTYSVARPRHVAASDASYAVIVLLSLATAVFILNVRPVHATFAALALAGLAALAGLGRGYRTLLARARPSRLRRFKRTWDGQSRWSLAAVAAAEAAANAHIYLLTAFIGAAAVAPIAASALLVRPMLVVQGALIEYERPQFVRHLHSRQPDALDRTIHWMRMALFLVWFGTVAAGAAILMIRPGLVFPADYDLGTLRLAAVLWALLQFVILAQVPEIVVMQAGNEYQFLARANVWAGIINLAGVIAIILAGLPVWTIAALIPGWLMTMVVIRLKLKRVRTRTFAR